MNPDKLFDYLEGKLSESERAELERQLVSDRQLQRELSIAREIQSRMRGDSREVLLPDEEAARGGKLALRIGTAFLFLVALNVGAGLWIIARHEAQNPNRKLLEAQMREQLRKSLEHATAALTPPSIGVTELIVPAAAGQLDTVASKVVATAKQLGGSATKGLPDNHVISVLVELPANRETEFRAVVAAIAGAAPSPISPNEAAAQSSEKKSFVVKVVEGATP
jgi:hypothetical protein